MAIRTDSIRVLIVAEHASLRFGGEAALPYHYFRVLCSRGIDTWMIVHERTREELKQAFPEHLDSIYFLQDTFWYRQIHKIAEILPDAVSYIIVGYGLRLFGQWRQMRVAKQLVRQYQIDVVHQPMPVSPKEPSLIGGLDVPVIIGPLNGGMTHPAAFQQAVKWHTRLTIRLGHYLSALVNRLIPGKIQATLVLVANQRTKAALPNGIRGEVRELVENGVDLSIWEASKQSEAQPELLSDALLKATQAIPQSLTKSTTRFIFVGRLVDWKAVDLLLTAFQQVAVRLPCELIIVGDGQERLTLENHAKTLGLAIVSTPRLASEPLREIKESQSGTVYFQGWLAQEDCAQQLRRADVFILPSLRECGGAVVLEAMAVGLPVIATAWGGPLDYVDKSCGILVEPTSHDGFVEGLAMAMQKLAESPDLRQTFGQNGYHRVLKQFDWEAKVDAMLQIYKDAMKLYQMEQQTSHSSANVAID